MPASFLEEEDLGVSVEFGIVTSVVPPGGWHYKQLLSNGETLRLTGDSFELLIENLREFRLRHSDLCGGAANADLAKIRQDLREFYCQNFRQNCAGGSNPGVQSGGIGMSNYVSPINKAADWLAAIGNQRQENVDPALAAQRAQVCAQCSQNVQWQTGCTACNQNIEVRTQNAKGNNRTPYDKNLMVCRSMGWKNDVAVWLKHSNEEPLPQLPGHCWRVTERG